MKRCVLLLFAVALPLLSSISPADEAKSGASAKPHLVIVIAEGEYKTDQTLPPFAEANLADDFRVTILRADEDNPNSVPGIKAIESADVILLSVRRRTLPPEQLAVVRKYVQRGGALVAIRTSSHAFCQRNKPAPDGLADWPQFDPEVLGGNYSNHHGNKVKSFVKTNDKSSSHPILKNVSAEEFLVFGSLYRCQPLAKSTTLLMTGRAEDIQPHEPVAWTNRPKTGSRVFYTSLGHPQDFKLPEFVRLLRNGIYWAAQRSIPDADVVTLKNPPQK